MGLFDKLFGTKEIAEAGSEVISKTVDSVANAVDKFVLTKQEKLDYEKQRLEQDFRFKTYEEENFQKVLDRDLDYYKIDSNDRLDARNLANKELLQDDIFVRRFRYIFAIGLCLPTFIYIGCITFLNIPKENQRFADVILGFLMSTVIGTVIGFFYGSSHSSMSKDNTINNLTK